MAIKIDQIRTVGNQDRPDKQLATKVNQVRKLATKVEKVRAVGNQGGPV